MAIQNLLCNSYFFTSEITFDDASLKILEKDKIIDNVSNSITDMEWIKVCDNRFVRQWQSYRNLIMMIRKY